jgi:hypothetical protein
MKEKIKKAKELYANRRYRALFILGLYAIFFMIVIAIFNTSSSAYVPIEEEKPKDVVLDKFGKLNNYEYSYKIERVIGSDVIYYNVDGKRYQNKEMFVINDDINDYYTENSTIYIIRDNLKEKVLEKPLTVDLLLLRPQNIVNLVLLSQLESKTDIYTDESVRKSYLLPVKDFIKLYFNEEVEENEKFISINTYEKDNEIIKVEIDLSSADQFDQYIIDFHKLEFNYSNFDKVEEFNKDIEE